MSAAPPRARCLLLASAISMVAYAASTPDPAGPLLALALSAVGVLVTSGLVGLRFPRVVAGLATLGVLLVTIARASERGLDIHAFGAFVVWMMVVKSFDRRNASDDAQLLAFAIFLAVASMLLNNGLVVAVLTLVFLPFVAYSAMHLQLRISHERAYRLARRKCAEPARVPPIRAASGAAAGQSLARTSVVALFLGFIFAALVFVVVPRGAGLRQIGMWGNPGAGRVVSFSDRVNVGTGGAVSTSRTPVLHLKLTNSEGEAIGGQGSVYYLRGAVLDTYADGTWTTSNLPVSVGETHNLLADESAPFGGPGGETAIFQEVLLLNTPREYRYLFTLWRPLSITPREPVDLAIYKKHGSVMASTAGGKFRYTVRSTPFDTAYRRRSEVREQTDWPSPIAAKVAREILEEAGVEPDPAQRSVANDGLAISAFRQYFWTHYTYSLGEPPPPDRVDPIDWFLTEADRGHCEHYASALAALCRSVGIPARVVTGYVAAEYNRNTGHYVVRESNAHAWVEAQYEPGYWKTYDATPPGDLMAIHGPKTGLMARAGRLLDAINYRWVSSVVWFDSASRTSLLSWSEPATGEIGEKADTVLRHLRVAPPGQIALLALRLFLVMAGTVLGVYGLGVLTRRWWRALARRPGAVARRITDPTIRGRVRGTPLYQDMLTILARAGYRKPEWQPLRDWGCTLEPRSAELAAVVGELAELFYLLRFGGRELDAGERARADSLMARLPTLAATAGRG